MDLIRAISATCDDMLEEVIERDFPNVKLVAARYQEQLEELLQSDSSFNVLLFKESFPLNMHPLNFIKQMRENYPHIRIVFIMTSELDDDVEKYTTYLHSKYVYDIIHDASFGIEELMSSLFSPKTAEDALRSAGNVSFENEFNNINSMNNLAGNGFVEENTYSKPEVSLNYNNNVSFSYPSSKVVTFWSPKGGSGADTLALQTAMMLARNTDIDVCIADFSETPNLHLHLNMPSEKRNLESLYIQQATGKLNVYTVDKYIVNGADTQFNLPNLHILPGAIRRITFFRQMEKVDGRLTVCKVIEDIVSILSQKYTVVILILSSNFYSTPTYAALKSCNQINMILEDDASSCVNAARCLHPNYGLFQVSNINPNKIKYVLNKRFNSESFFIDNFTKLHNVSIDAQVGLYPQEMYEAYKTVNPEFVTKSSESAKYDILSVVNTITQMNFIVQEPQDESKGVFGLFKSRKK